MKKRDLEHSIATWLGEMGLAGVQFADDDGTVHGEIKAIKPTMSTLKCRNGIAKVEDRISWRRNGSKPLEGKLVVCVQKDRGMNITILGDDGTITSFLMRDDLGNDDVFDKI